VDFPSVAGVQPRKRSQSCTADIPNRSSFACPPDHRTRSSAAYGSLAHHRAGRGPDGDPKSPNAANVDESKVPTYALPDPLILKNGQRVNTAEMWWKDRRPEIVEDFDREIYGRAPKDTPKVNWELTSTARENNEGVEVITRKLVGHVAEERNVAVPAVPAAKTKGSTGRQHVATARTLPTAEIAAAIVPFEGGFVVVLIVSVFTYARILSSRAHHIARKAHSRTRPCLSPVRR
jgi:hypothetical protein